MKCLNSGFKRTVGLFYDSGKKTRKNVVENKKKKRKKETEKKKRKEKKIGSAQPDNNISSAVNFDAACRAGSPCHVHRAHHA